MIVSKQALNAVGITVVDKGVKVLDNVHIEMDGTVVGSHREGVIVVSPITKEIREKLVIKEEDSESITLSSDTIRETIKFIGVDKKFKGLLEHCDIVKTEKGEAKITLFDGKRSRAIQTKAYSKDYYDYVSLLRRVYNKRSAVRIVLNRKRLLSLLETIDDICADKGDFSPVYLEFTDENDIIMRTINAKTGQKAIGIARGFKTDKWMDTDKWERRLTGIKRRDLQKMRCKRIIRKRRSKKYVRQRKKKTT